MSQSEFYPLTIGEVRPETADCVSVLYTVPDECKAAFRAKAGQYVTLKAEIDGEPVRRCYSICEQEDDTGFRIAVKKVDGGKFSTYVVDKLKAGAKMDVMPPMGNFTTERLKGGARPHYVAIAAGSGITPVIAIAREILSGGADARFTLIYQNAARDKTIFREQLLDLKNRYMGKFNPVFIFSREQSEDELTSGRIDQSKLELMFRHFPEFGAAAGYFLCGPEDLTGKVEEFLTGHGVEPAKIVREMFVNQGQTVSKLRSSMSTARHEGECELSFKMNGTTRTLSVPFDRTILDSLLAKGINVPFACHGGVCSTCKMKVEQGEINMPVNFALEKDQVAEKLALSCCCFPVSDKLSINYDI